MPDDQVHSVKTAEPFQSEDGLTAQLLRPDADGQWAGDLVEEWSKLADSAIEPNVYYSPELLLPALKHLASGQDVRIFLLWEGEAGASSLLGLVPVCPSRRIGKAPLPNIATWQHPLCYLGAPLVAHGQSGAFWSHLRGAVAGAWWGGLLRIANFPLNGPLGTGLVQHCADAGVRDLRMRSRKRAFIRVPEDPEAYWQQQLTGKKRKELRRQRRRLADQGVLTFSLQRGESDLGRWLDDFMAVEASGWKAERGTAIRQSDAEQAYFQEAMRKCVSAGRFMGVDCYLDDTAYRDADQPDRGAMAATPSRPPMTSAMRRIPRVSRSRSTTSA